MLTPSFLIDAEVVFAHNEVEPLQNEFEQINQWLGTDVFTFNPYQIAVAKVEG